MAPLCKGCPADVATSCKHALQLKVSECTKTCIYDPGKHVIKSSVGLDRARCSEWAVLNRTSPRGDIKQKRHELFLVSVQVGVPTGARGADDDGSVRISPAADSREGCPQTTATTVAVTIHLELQQREVAEICRPVFALERASTCCSGLLKLPGLIQSPVWSTSCNARLHCRYPSQLQPVSTADD